MMDYVTEAENIVKKKYDAAKQFYENHGLAEYFKMIRGRHKYLCIFGSGVLGTTLCNWLQDNGVAVDFFCDNDVSKTGKIKENVEIIDFTGLEAVKQDVFVIVSATNKGEGHKYNDDINQQLADFKYVMPDILNFIAYYVSDFKLSCEECMDIAKKTMDMLQDEHSKQLYRELLSVKFVEKVSSARKNPLEAYFNPLQYFTPEMYLHREDECIVDCGAFNGDTLKRFIEIHGDSFERYDCFEMDRRAFGELEEYIGKLPENRRDKISAYQLGVYSRRQKSYYNRKTDTLASALNSDGTEEANLVALDDVLKGKKVTMIKMDIEGSELSALTGAQDTIRREHPFLAVSIYHSTEQFFKVPLFIIENFPFYRIYIRQHTTITDDTVLYAMPV